MLLLGVVRLSDLTDETTSPERQRAKIARYVQQGEHTLAGVAEDLDVSGAISPFDRPELGPWLNRPGEWDGLVVAKLDRLTRSLFDFLTLWRWLDERGKTLISLDPQLDFSTAIGRLVAQILVMFAEFEREMIRDRVRDAYHAIRKAGHFPGGSYPFGWMPVRNGKGWRLEHDPEYAPVVQEMVARYLAGASLAKVADWLNETGVPASRDLQRIRAGRKPAGHRWTSPVVHKFLISPALLGQASTSDGLLRDDDGLIVRYADGPLIDQETTRLLTAAREQRSNRRGAQRNSAALLRVTFCALCDAPLYSAYNQVRGNSGKSEKLYHYRYYLCKNANVDHLRCPARKLPANGLEELACRMFVGLVGDQEITEKIVVPAEDNGVAAVDEAIAALEDAYVSGDKAVSAERYLATMARLEEKRSRLAARPSAPERVEHRPTGETFRQRWDASDTQGRRQMMINAGFEIRIARTKANVQTLGRADRRRLASKHERALAELLAGVGVTEVPTAAWDVLRSLLAPSANLTIAYTVDPDLARRAGLAASGQPVTVPEVDGELWQRVLGPVREHMGKSPLTSVDAHGQADAAGARQER